MTADETITSYPLSSRNRVKRRHDRGFYDHDTVHGLLDASMLCHVSYVIDGQPYCTPTFFWREGTTLYWHGSSASRPAVRGYVSRSLISTVWCWQGAGSIIPRTTVP